MIMDNGAASPGNLNPPRGPEHTDQSRTIAARAPQPSEEPPRDRRAGCSRLEHHDGNRERDNVLLKGQVSINYYDSENRL